MSTRLIIKKYRKGYIIDMNLFGKNTDLWEDYLAWGFGFAIILSLIDYNKDSFASACLVILFCLITDTKENLQIFFRFLKEKFIFFFVVIISTVHFLMLQPAYPSHRMPITVFLLVYVGYRLAVDTQKRLILSLKKMGIIVVASVLMGLFWHMKGQNDIVPYFPYANAVYWSDISRLCSVYVHPLIAACIIMSCTILLLGLVKNIVYKTVLVMISSLAILFTMTRMAIMVFFLCLLVYFIAFGSFRTVTVYIHKQNIKVALAWAGVVLIVILGMTICKRGVFIDLFVKLINRFRGIASGGNVYRWDAWNTLAHNIIKRPWRQVICGSGATAGYSFLDTNEWMIAKHGEWSGPVDNMYLSVLYDYGVIGFISLLSISISVVLVFFRSKDKLQRVVALALIAIFLQSLTADFQYWPNIAFVMFVLCGIHLGLKVSGK